MTPHRRLVNNAGIVHIGTIEQTSRLTSIALPRQRQGRLPLARAAVPIMRRQGGVILNLASIASLIVRRSLA
jgi:short-subunit dehydrogenase